MIRKNKKVKKNYISPSVEITSVAADNERRKGYVKLIIMVCILALAYMLSVLTADVKTTNVKMLSVLLFVIVGFLITIVIFYLSVYVSYIIERGRRRRNVKKVVYDLKDFTSVLESNENIFVYNKKESFTENLSRVKDIIFNIIKDVALKIKGDGKRNYLKFTVSDAIKIAMESISKIQVKADGFFEILHLENKPLYIVESSLQKLIEGEKEEELAATEESSFFSFLKKAKSKAVNIGVNVAVTVFKSNIEKFVSDILKSVLVESVKLYSGSEIKASEDIDNE